MKNIALVTNTKFHHKYWVSELYKANNVRLIIHPSPGSKNLKDKLFGSRNLIWSLLKILSVFYNKFCSDSSFNQLNKAEKVYFKAYESEYNKRSQPCLAD
jgi:hypothetical protein